MFCEKILLWEILKTTSIAFTELLGITLTKKINLENLLHVNHSTYQKLPKLTVCKTEFKYNENWRKWIFANDIFKVSKIIATFNSFGSDLQ